MSLIETFRSIITGARTSIKENFRVIISFFFPSFFFQVAARAPHDKQGRRQDRSMEMPVSHAAAEPSHQLNSSNFLVSPSEINVTFPWGKRAKSLAEDHFPATSIIKVGIAEFNGDNGTRATRDLLKFREHR